MKVSEKVRLATGLIEISGTSTKKVEHIAKELKTTPHFLQQISGQLRKSGLIDTVHGPGGGIHKPSARTTCSLYEIFESLGCAQKDDDNNQVQCALNTFSKDYLIHYDKTNTKGKSEETSSVTELKVA
jgi:DNA-binding IscR family transcriptional regulator